MKLPGLECFSKDSKYLRILTKAALVLILLFATYSILGFFVVPKLVSYLIKRNVAKYTKCWAELEKVSFNPYRLELKIHGLSLKSSVEKDFVLDVGYIDVNIESASIPKKALIISELRIEKPFMSIVRRKDGTLNFMNVLKTDTDDGREKKTASGFHFSINNINIAGGSIKFRDVQKGAVHKIEEIKIGIPFVSNTRHNIKIYTKPYLFILVDGSPFELKARTRPFAPDRDTRVFLELKNVDVTRYTHYIPEFSGVKITSCILNTSLSLHFALDEKGKSSFFVEGRVVLSGVQLSKLGRGVAFVKQVELVIEPSRPLSGDTKFAVEVADLFVEDIFGSSGDKVLIIPDVTVRGGRINLNKSLLEFGEIQLNSPKVRFEINKDGSTNLEELIKYVGSESTGNSDAGKEKGKRIKVVFPMIRLNKGTVFFRDLSHAASPVSLTVNNVNVLIDNVVINDNENRPFNYRISGEVSSGGNFSIGGQSDVGFLSAQLMVKVSGVSLSQFQGYLSDFLNLRVESGYVSFDSKVSLQRKDGKNVVSLSGSLRVDNVFMFDRSQKGPFVKWKSVSITGINLRSEPLTVSIDAVDIAGLYEHMVILEDGSLNVSRVFKYSKGEETKGTDVYREKRKSTGMFFAVKKINLKNCVILIEDKQVKPTFIREIDRISGTVLNLSNKPGTRASVKITAFVDDRSRLNISGKLSPFGDSVYADFRVKLEGAGLTRFSPYAQKFLGYRIDKGKLFLDLDVSIHDNIIKVDNRFLLDQFELGKPVKSKNAIKAPVRLAIALLKDRSGRIDINVPVRGKLDDPEFSYRNAVLKAFVNIIIKAATSPFSLITSIVGTNEKLDRIYFEPGLSILTEEARKKLNLLAKVLNERPGLRINVTGFYDPEKDRRALLEIKFKHLLKIEKFKELVSKKKEISSIDSIEILPGEYEKYLKRAYKRGAFKKPKNIIGLIKSQPVKVMEQMIKKHISVSDDDLRNLALERAKTIANYLVQSLKIDADRVFLVAPEGQNEIDKVAAPIVRFSLR